MMVTRGNRGLSFAVHGFDSQCGYFVISGFSSRGSTACCRIECKSQPGPVSYHDMCCTTSAVTHRKTGNSRRWAEA